MENNQSFSTSAVNSVESKRDMSDSIKSDVIIKRAKVDSLTIYEIKENELQLLQNGSESSLYLNICISSFSFFVSFFISLLTASFNGKETVQTVFIVISVVTFCFSIIYLIRWIRARKDLKNIFDEIKKRVQ